MLHYASFGIKKNSAELQSMTTKHELAHARPTTPPARTFAALAHADAVARRPHCRLLDVLFRRRHGTAAVLGAPLGAPSTQLALRTSRDELVFSNP